MQGGFSFDGVDIADLHLTYVPENQNTYVYKPSTWNNHEETFDGHHGGYFYGATVKPKEFTLRCIFEDEHVNSGVLTKIFNLFKRNKSGKLIFQKRPWLWYMATVNSCELTQMTNYLNGVITIKMKAYYPFARSDQNYISDDDPNETDLLANSGMMKGIAWNMDKDFAADEALTDQTEIVCYNPGTEDASVAIEIAGDIGDGVTIANRTTGQILKFVALTKALTTNVNKYLLLDGLNGKALLTNGQTSSYGFLYHDNGIITMKSGYPAIRDIRISGTARSHSVFSDGQFTSDMKGKYISYVQNGATEAYGDAGLEVLHNSDTEGVAFSKIIDVVSENEITVSRAFDANYTGAANIIGANEIIITPAGESMELTRLVFHYKPTFS